MAFSVFGSTNQVTAISVRHRFFKPLPEDPRALPEWRDRLRGWFRKLSVEMIVEDGWILLYHGNLYVGGEHRPDFRKIRRKSSCFEQYFLEGPDAWPPDATIAIIDLGAGETLGYEKWNRLSCLDPSALRIWQ
jgi:hypothetical protein